MSYYVRQAALMPWQLPLVPHSDSSGRKSMNDWMQTLKQAGQTAQDTEADILKLIANEQATLDHALRLLVAIEALADEFDEIIAAIRMDDEIDSEMLAAAEAIEDFWADLSSICLNKVRALQDVAKQGGTND